MSDTLPPLPEHAGFRTRYRSEPGMIGHYPWTYADQGRRRIDRPECEYENLFTADQMRSYAAAALDAHCTSHPRGPAMTVLHECLDNDSPWLICKHCGAVGRCEKDASQRPAAVRHCPTCDQARSRGCWDPDCKWPCGPNSDSTSAPKEQ